jgi:GrpB-like predicted nucleotidyltransferase (UPF0157 family)
VTLSEADPTWAHSFAVEENRIRAAVGEAVVELHHVGSTSVPGLAAKPIIDIVLVVTDSTDEPRYVPALEAAGYPLYLREPHWQQHRLFKRGMPHFTPPEPGQSGSGRGVKVNLHAFTSGSDEAHRMLVFRDWLRAHPADRDHYEQTERALAGRRWAYVQDYADAKSAIVGEIMQRALNREDAVP